MRVLECVLQVTVVLVLSWACEASTGGCSRYGHACWGGHGKRSSHAVKALPVTLPVRDVDLEAAESGDASETAQDADDAELEAARVEAADALRRRGYQPYQVDRVDSVLPAHLADLISLPREPVVQDPDPVDESEELMHRIRSQNRRRPKNRENDVQVLII
ncbi:CCHamide-1, partial [Frankliniella occidentalis]